MSLSNRALRAFFAGMFGKATGANFGAFASPPTIFVGVSSTTPTAAGANVTEPTTGSYARVETAASDWNNPTDADPTVIDNANAVVFPESTAAWLSSAPLTHGVLFDAATDGNFLGFGALSPNRTVNAAGFTLSLPAGAIDITLTGA